MTNNNSKKDLTKYTQTKPEQLQLFEILDASLEDYSNSIELYDTMPKYFLGGVERIKDKTGEFLPILNREFVHRTKSYKLDISPAAVLDKKTGKTIYYYPSQREELVEDALRKIATRGGSVQFDDKVGVKFSYYEVQQELLRTGHGYSITEIKLAIEIMSKAGLEIVSKEGNEISMTSNFFTFVGKETKEMAGKERAVVIFHSLVTKSINTGTYRLFNYDKLMRMKMPLARWIHKRISHMFSQATINNPYQIKLSTIVRDSGMKSYKTISERARQIEKALEELTENKIIFRFDSNPDKEKNKILDVLYSLYVTEEFVADAKKANKVANLRLSGSEGIKEALDLERLRNEIEKPIYGLSKTFINNLLEKIITTKEYDEISDSLLAAKEWIEKCVANRKDVNKGATTKSAIKEGWKSSAGNKSENNDNKREEKEIIDIQLKQQYQQKEEARIASVTSFESQWGQIREEIRLSYDPEIYRKWLSELRLYSYMNNELTLEAETKFLRDWIAREFLEKKIEPNLQTLIMKIEPSCKKVNIVCLKG